VNHLKEMSSRMLRKEFAELAALEAQIWTPNYFAASAGGAPIERLMGYGEAQEKPSRRTGFVSQNSHRSKTPRLRPEGGNFSD
jgi:REP element-mobilizing transposase RayT